MRPNLRALRWVNGKLPIILVALAVTSLAAQAALLTVMQNNSTVFMRGERFDLDSSFVVDSSSIMVAPEDASPLGTETSPVEMDHHVPAARTALTRDHWTYSVVLKEKSASSVQSGNFAVDLYVSGDTMSNAHMGTVYVTQQDSDPGEVEGVEVTWGVGEGLPDNPLFLVKLGPYAAPANVVAYTLESDYDPAVGFVWTGVGGAIDGQVNPTLTADVGDLVRITYRHGSNAGDDAPHDMRIKDASGATLVHGDHIEEPGDEQVIEWTPTLDGTYTYVCAFHATTQKGTIEVGAGSQPTVVTYTMESAYDAVNGIRWRGVGGSIDGQYNPTLAVNAGETLRIVYLHADDVGDDAPHNVRIKVDGTTVISGSDVDDPGDEQTVEWTFQDVPGEARYECKYHAGTQKGTITVS